MWVRSTPLCHWLPDNLHLGGRFGEIGVLHERLTEDELSPVVRVTFKEARDVKEVKNWATISNLADTVSQITPWGLPPPRK